MKRTFLSKTIGMLGMLATLSAIVGAGVQQTARAQESTQSDVEFLAEQSRVRVEQSLVRAIPDFCPALLSAEFKNLPPQFYDEEGNFRTWLLFGLNLTPEQLAVVEQANEKIGERAEALNLQLKKEVNPNASLDMLWKYPPNISEDAIADIQEEIIAAVDDVEADLIFNSEQVDELQEKYDQYVEFSMSPITSYTPEQFFEVQSMEREFVATIATAFDNPDQLDTFLKNADVEAAWNACTPKPLAKAPGSTPSPAPVVIPSPRRVPREEGGKIIAIAADNGRFNTLVAAIEAAGLTETLDGAGPYTVFVPTDDAFAALPEGILDKLLLPENKETLAKILTYHVLAGEFEARDLKANAGALPTVEGGDLDIAVAATGQVTVNGNGLTPVDSDILVGNGVIHVINEVLLPPDVDLNAL